MICFVFTVYSMVSMGTSGEIEGLASNVEIASSLPIPQKQLGDVAAARNVTGPILYGGFQFRDTDSGEWLLFTVSSYSSAFQQLWLASLNPWQPKKIAEVANREFSGRNALESLDAYSISPDGTRVAYTRKNGYRGDIFIYTVETEETYRLTYSPAVLEYDLLWLGGGTHLLLSRDANSETSSGREIYTLELGPNTEKRIWSTRDLLPRSYYTTALGEIYIRPWYKENLDNKLNSEHLVVHVENGKVTVTSVDGGVLEERIDKDFYAYTVQAERDQHNREDVKVADGSGEADRRRDLWGEIWIESGADKRLLFRAKGVGYVLGWANDHSYLYFLWTRESEDEGLLTNVFKITL